MLNGSLNSAASEYIPTGICKCRHHPTLFRFCDEVHNQSAGGVTIGRQMITASK